MASRGKKRQEGIAPFEETLYRYAARQQFLMHRAANHVAKELGIQTPPPKRRLIEQKSDGTFLYNSKQITNDIDTQYMRVFRAIFESESDKDYIPYAPLNSRIELYGEEKLLDEGEAVKRIQNGVKEFFYKTKIPKLLHNGKKLIDYKRGKGVIFINPDID